MAKYNTTANVVLSINGKQAQKMLAQLQKDAQRLEKQLRKASTAGDKATMKKLQREITSTNKLIQQLQGSAATAEQVLSRLSSASPRDLNKALRTLQQQLNGIQRGTAAWDNHIAKIKAVKAEIAKLNASMATQKSLWSRMNLWLNNCQTALIGMAAAVSGLVLAGRKAVNAFADMEEAMANTRKYTRMSREDVELLNQAFLRMDTRLSREELNMLAQEAGRLGKNTIEAVKGYVEASQIIKVALVDLGEGATQSIAKLTNIFGVEQLLGTKDAMLAVGSTVNHLSQNCTASKQYLVEFANRMAGIGATAGMTIPEILALGAVLDANGQKVEMSATAIQKVLMNLANKNKAFAKSLGMDADLLNQTLKRSAREGLLMFLDRLHEIGDATDYTNATMTLAPAFKDMGLDAARISQVLATLAKHVDELKWQLGEATTAFDTATSATNEFNIFNNTAQATLSKAKNRVHEIAVELGENLYPVMRHIYTSSSAFLRVLNTIVSFLVKHSTALVQLCLVLAAYAIAVNAAEIRLRVHYAWLVLNEKAALLMKKAILLTQLAFYAMTGQVTKCNAAFRLLNTTMKTTPWGIIAAAVAALGVAIYNLVTRTTEAEKATAEFGKKMTEAKGKANSYNSEMQREQHELAVLIGKLDAAKKGTSEYNNIKDKIIKQYGQYLSGLIDEKGEINNLTAAYDRLTKAIRRNANEKGIAEARDAVNSTYYTEMTEQLNALQESLESFGADPRKAASLVQSVSMAVATGQPLSDDVTAEINKYSKGRPKGLNPLATLKYSLLNVDPNFLWGVAKGVNGVVGKIMPGDVEQYIDNSPADITNRIYKRRDQRNNALVDLDAMHDAVNPMRKVNDRELEMAIESLKTIIDSGKRGSALIHDAGNVFRYLPVTLDKARQLYTEYTDEAAIRKGSVRADHRDPDINTDYTDPNPKGGNADLGLNLSETADERRERLARERAAREAERAAKKALKEDLKEQKRKRDEELAANESKRREDLITETQYLKEKDRIQLEYLDASKKVLEERGLQETAEYAAMVKKEEEITTAALERMKKNELATLKTQYTSDSTANTVDYHSGKIDYNTYMDRKEKLDLEYVDKRLAVYKEYNATETQEYAQLLAEKEKMLQTHLERQQQLKREAIDREHTDKLNTIETDYYTPGSDTFLDSTKHEQKVFEELVRYLKAKRDTYLKGSQEWQRLDNQITDATNQRSQAKQKEYADMYKVMMAKEVKKTEYQQQLALLDSVYQREMQLAEGNEKRKTALTRAYHMARIAMAKQYGIIEGNAMKKAIGKSVEWLESEGGQAVVGTINTMVSGLSDIFSAATSLMQAELDIQTAAINKRYDTEIENAQGNTYKIKKLEEQKEKEIAQAKNEANRKMFEMQVIQAIAQTATNALAAYGSAAAVPVIGYILAPIAAGMAVAAGAIQIAAIKKQQQASEAQGYSEGGFTPDGYKDEPVGIVHAGEWVASQKLTRNPKTRPLLEALDKAQRNNTIGSITAADVSRSITAPMAIASAPAVSRPPVVNVNVQPTESGSKELTETLSLLRKRLDTPFITVNTVTGDHGIQKAQDEYDRLMRNKTPKSKRK